MLADLSIRIMAIWECTGESVAAVSSSPFLETLRKKGIEVPIDGHH